MDPIEFNMRILVIYLAALLAGWFFIMLIATQ